MVAIIPITARFTYPRELSHILDVDLGFRFSTCLAAYRAFCQNSRSLDLLSTLSEDVGERAEAKNALWHLARLCVPLNYAGTAPASGTIQEPFTRAITNLDPRLEEQIKSISPYRIWWHAFNDAMRILLMPRGDYFQFPPNLKTSPNGTQVFSLDSIKDTAWLTIAEARQEVLVSDNSEPWLITPTDVDFGEDFLGVGSFDVPRSGANATSNYYRSMVKEAADKIEMTSYFPAMPNTYERSGWCAGDFGLVFGASLSRWWNGDNPPLVEDGRLKQIDSATSGGFSWPIDFPYHGYCGMVAALRYLEESRCAWARNDEIEFNRFTIENSGRDGLVFIEEIKGRGFMAAKSIKVDDSLADVTLDFTKTESSRSSEVYDRCSQYKLGIKYATYGMVRYNMIPSTFDVGIEPVVPKNIKLGEDTMTVTSSAWGYEVFVETEAERQTNFFCTLADADIQDESLLSGFVQDYLNSVIKQYLDESKTMQIGSLVNIGSVMARPKYPDMIIGSNCRRVANQEKSLLFVKLISTTNDNERDADRFGPNDPTATASVAIKTGEFRSHEDQDTGAETYYSTASAKICEQLAAMVSDAPDADLSPPETTLTKTMLKSAWDSINEQAESIVSGISCSFETRQGWEWTDVYMHGELLKRIKTPVITDGNGKVLWPVNDPTSPGGIATRVAIEVGPRYTITFGMGQEAREKKYYKSAIIDTDSQETVMHIIPSCQISSLASRS